MIGHPAPDSGAHHHGLPQQDTSQHADGPQQVVISVDDQHLSDIDTVVAGLQGVGMVIEEVMTGIGMITGSLPNEEGTQTVVQVVGVASVQRQITYHLPPPDADVQ